jgi:hypothetical protein
VIPSPGEYLNFAVKAIPRVQALAAIAAPSPFSTHKSKEFKVIENGRFWNGLRQKALSNIFNYLSVVHDHSEQVFRQGLPSPRQKDGSPPGTSFVPTYWS